MEENSARTREMWKRESKCAEKDGRKRRWTKRKSTLEELVRAKKSCTLINSSLTEKRAITAPSRYHDYAHAVVKTVRRALKDRWFTGRVQWRRATMEIFREQFKKFTAFFSRDRPDKSDTSEKKLKQQLSENVFRWKGPYLASTKAKSHVNLLSFFLINFFLSILLFAISVVLTLSSFY